MSEKCQDAERRLHDYLDRELSAAELQVVAQHLDECPPCLDKFAVQEHLNRLVKVHCQETAPSRLRKYIGGLLRS
jgi:mycothiol system anti-sigma-R factor